MTKLLASIALLATMAAPCAAQQSAARAAQLEPPIPTPRQAAMDDYVCRNSGWRPGTRDYFLCRRFEAGKRIEAYSYGPGPTFLYLVR